MIVYLQSIKHKEKQRIGVPAFIVGILFCYKRPKIQKTMATNYMTAEGYKKLVEELNELERVQRPAISKQIGEARDKGDLSENAEYDAAKEAQGMLEMRISNLKAMVASARMIDESKISTKEVQILTRVKIKNTKTEQIMTYMIVSESEANFKEGKLSVTTPIAKGLLGKKVGQKATVSVPNGQLEFEVMEITL
jgi:transcription elongation factor GreA